MYNNDVDNNVDEEDDDDGVDDDGVYDDSNDKGSKNDKMKLMIMTMIGYIIIISI